MAKTYKTGRRREFATGQRKRDLRDTIAVLEADRRAHQRQLAGETETRFSEAWLRQRIAELTTSLEGHRRTLATL